MLLLPLRPQYVSKPRCDDQPFIMSTEKFLEANNAPAQQEAPAIEWKAFLESVPPNVEYKVTDFYIVDTNGRIALSTPDITLHCWSDVCDGIRTFTFTRTDSQQYGIFLRREESLNVFLTYFCRNCRVPRKTFSVMVRYDDYSATAIKYGEYPTYGPHTPSRLISLIGPHRDLFLKGRRAESQGLGIGAFAYYRRVVENEKDRLFDAIIKVSQKIRASAELIDNLETAKRETQFSNAVERIKIALPDVLNINGHNPLTLLHSALSEGLHAQTDEECLELAESIRLVLAGLAERISQALKDEAELSVAVTKLMQRKNSNQTKEQ